MAYHKRGKLVHGYFVKNHPLYTTWCGLRSRCNNPDDAGYHNYGGRGITVSEEWNESFETFALDMGLKPSPEHTLDRIDNNKGYCKDNCRWATRTEQCLNRRKFRNNTSSKTGVIKKKNGKFNAKYDEYGKRYNLGNFNTIVEAVRYRREFVALLAVDENEALKMTERRAHLDSSTKIRGISKHPEGYMVRFTLPDGNRIFVGFSHDFESAVKLQEEFSKLYKTNPKEAISQIKNKPHSNSKTGVRGINANEYGFIVRVKLPNGIRKRIGCFKTLDEATRKLNEFKDQL